MKTRSNMPLFVVACSNVKQLTDEQINMLRCGDYLVKRDASGEHAYKVTFKSATGMCITYHDAYCVETQSYDLVNGHWVYNSEDKTIIAEPSLENIVDADGHNRFIEGDITINEITGITQTFGKWSLSGTHLMIVVAISVANGTEIGSGANLGSFTVPSWIYDKITILYGTDGVDRKNFTFVASGGSTQNVNITLRKSADKLSFISGALTLSADRNARIEYDLLIDNE